MSRPFQGANTSLVIVDILLLPVDCSVEFVTHGANVLAQDFKFCDQSGCGRDEGKNHPDTRYDQRCLLHSDPLSKEKPDYSPALVISVAGMITA
jgi:hypothetical protein